MVHLNNFTGDLHVKNVPISVSTSSQKEMLHDDESVASNTFTVEDVPSPQEKNDTDSKDASSEKQATQKGQTKLNFFGKSGKKSGKEPFESETPRKSQRIAKRSPGEHTKTEERKRQRKSEEKSENKDSADDDIFRDDAINERSQFTRASLGQ